MVPNITAQSVAASEERGQVHANVNLGHVLNGSGFN